MEDRSLQSLSWGVNSVGSFEISPWLVFAEGVECGHGGEPGGLVRELLQESRPGVMVPWTSRVAVGIYSTNQF